MCLPFNVFYFFLNQEHFVRELRCLIAELRAHLLDALLHFAAHLRVIAKVYRYNLLECLEAFHLGSAVQFPLIQVFDNPFGKCCFNLTKTRFNFFLVQFFIYQTVGAFEFSPQDSCFRNHRCKGSDSNSLLRFLQIVARERLTAQGSAVVSHRKVTQTLVLGTITWWDRRVASLKNQKILALTRDLLQLNGHCQGLNKSVDDKEESAPDVALLLVALPDKSAAEKHLLQVKMVQIVLQVGDGKFCGQLLRSGETVLTVLRIDLCQKVLSSVFVLKSSQVNVKHVRFGIGMDVIQLQGVESLYN